MVNENLESAMEIDNKLSEEARTKLPELQIKLQEHFNNIERNGEYIKFKQGYDSELLRFEPERKAVKCIIQWKSRPWITI